MESLQMMKFSIRKGRSLNFTDGFKWGEEIKEIEYLARTDLPTDAENYGRNLTEVVDEDEDEMEENLEDLRKDELEGEAIGKGKEKEVYEGN
jgi:hypothetical protein